MRRTSAFSARIMANMFPVIQVGPLSIQARGVILLAAIWFATEAAERGAKRLGVSGDAIYNLTLLAGVCGLIGARLGYALDHFTIYRNYPAALVALDLNTLSAAWGALAASLAACGYARRKGIANRTLLDALTPGFLVLAFGLALADLASGDGYGLPVSLPWSIELWGAARHPTQIYLLLAVGLISLIVLKSDRPFAGYRFGLGIVLYAAAYLIVDGFRGDSTIVNGVRLAQVWCLAVIVVTLFVLRHWAKSEQPTSVLINP